MRSEHTVPKASCEGPAVALARLLSGADSHRAQGVLLSMPAGYSGRPAFAEAASEAYGGTAHPDLRCLGPEGAGRQITVDAIRGVDAFLCASPTRDTGQRVAKTLALFHADRLNASATGAILKSLEEPSGHTRILLLTDCPDRLEATIRSRCLIRRLHADPDAAAAEVRYWAATFAGDAPHAPGDDDVAAKLSLLDGNPRLAAAAWHYGLSDWIETLGRWARRPDPDPPLPPMGRKTDPDFTLIAEIAQAIVAGKLRGVGGPAPAALWSFATRMGAAGRAGMDGKTRLHTGLMALARAMDATA